MEAQQNGLESPVATHAKSLFCLSPQLKITTFHYHNIRWVVIVIMLFYLLKESAKGLIR